MPLIQAPDMKRRPVANDQAPNVPGDGIVQGLQNVAVVPDEISESPRDLAFPVRRARMRIVMPLAPHAILAVMRDEFGLIARKGGPHPGISTPKGVFETDDPRRNVFAPASISYGSISQLAPVSETVVF